MGFSFSNSTIETIKSQVNIVDVVGRVVQLKRAGSNHKGVCPFHNEKTPSFVVSEIKYPAIFFLLTYVTQEAYTPPPPFFFQIPPRSAYPVKNGPSAPFCKQFPLPSNHLIDPVDILLYILHILAPFDPMRAVRIRRRPHPLGAASGTAGHDGLHFLHN